MARQLPAWTTAVTAIAKQGRTIKVCLACLVFLSIITILWNYGSTLGLSAWFPMAGIVMAKSNSTNTNRSDTRRQLSLKDDLCAKDYSTDNSWRNDVTDPGPPYQCVGSIGRLGNVMFIYASSLGVARLGNRTLVVNPAYSLLPHFRIKALVDRGGYLCRKPKKKYDTGCCRFSPSLLQPEERSPALMVGTYVQSWRYFAHVEREVRSQFQPYGDTGRRAASFIRSIRRQFSEDLQGPVTLVGVHVRRGDVANPLQNFGYRLPSPGYFRRAMLWYLEKFPRVAFAICSDEKDYVMENIIPLCGRESARQNSSSIGNKRSANDSAQLRLQPAQQQRPDEVASRRRASDREKDEKRLPATRTGSPGLLATADGLQGTVTRPTGEATQQLPEDVEPVPGARCRYVGTESATVDMAVLAGCDHFIMSMGTYSWWAGWLTGGIVVYYRHPAREGSSYSKIFNHADFFPPHWVPLE